MCVITEHAEFSLDPNSTSFLRPEGSRGEGTRESPPSKESRACSLRAKGFHWRRQRSSCLGPTTLNESGDNPQLPSCRIQRSTFPLQCFWTPPPKSAAVRRGFSLRGPSGGGGGVLEAVCFKLSTRRRRTSVLLFCSGAQTYPVLCPWFGAEESMLCLGAKNRGYSRFLRSYCFLVKRT